MLHCTIKNHALTFLAIMMPVGLCSTLKTTPPLPNPSSAIRRKCCSFISPCWTILRFSLRNTPILAFCSSERSTSSRAFDSVSILHKKKSESLHLIASPTLPWSRHPYISAHSLLVVSTAMMPPPAPSGLSVALLEAGAELRLRAGGFFFFSDILSNRPSAVAHLGDYLNPSNT